MLSSEFQLWEAKPEIVFVGRQIDSETMEIYTAGDRLYKAQEDLRLIRMFVDGGIRVKALGRFNLVRVPCTLQVTL